MLEENHYYPFGLAMAGICDKALKLNYTENKYRYNGGTELQNKEFSDGSGLELYDANARMYDPQIGRFGGIDAMSDQTTCLSPYQFAYNDPTLFNDPGGMKAANPNSNTYNPAEQQYINGLADPMGHGDDWGEEFMLGGGGGGFDQNGNLVIGTRAGFYNGQEGYWEDYEETLNDGVYRGFGNESSLNSLNFGKTFIPYNNMGSDNNQESNGWQTISTISKNFDRSMVASGDVIFSSLAVSSSLTKETFNIISEVPVLKQLGVITSAVSAYNHASNFIKDPNWKDGLEFLGNAALLTAHVVFSEEELAINTTEFIYNNVTTIIDLFDSD